MKPNLFIAGAPKTGTTSLSEYLREHVNIFISDPKEIHYFAYDFPKYRYVENLDQYVEIFKESNSNCKIIGEASVYYLYSKIALSEIKIFNPESKIIIMLRNPAELSISQHAEMVFNCNENVFDFQKAWYLQESRKKGLNIPSGCRDIKTLFYKDIALLGKQVIKLLKIFDNQQVHFVFLDDLKKNPRRTYQDVLNFLGVPDDGRSKFPIINKRKQYRWRWLAKISQTPPPPIIWLVRNMRLKYGINLGYAIKTLRNINSTTAVSKTSIPNEFLKEITQEFKSDIELLEEITNKKLTQWKF